nr:putative zinc-binding domain protein [uncultured bacterium]
MTSNDTKGQRLRQARLKRAKALEGIDPRRDPAPQGAVPADLAELAHNNTYDLLPRFYIDRAIVCRRCGTEEVWPAERQKWWYEVAKGNINTDAVLCRSCRETEKTRKAEARRSHLEGVARKRAKHGN